MAEIDLAVIGAGPAGLAAAVTAARTGVGVTLIDEYPRPGGQYLKDQPSGNQPAIPVAEKQGRALLRDLASLNAIFRSETLVWGLAGPDDPEGRLRVDLYGPGGLESIEAAAVVVATGARELVIPFSGWTLPGVMTAGAAQLLVKGYGILPGQRVLLAGSGPLLLPVANELAGRGIGVAAVLEATRPVDWLGYSRAVWGNWDRLGEGWRYWRGLRRAGVPYRFGRAVVQALGVSSLEGVVLAQLDRTGRPVPGSEERVEVDTLCQSFGFTPNVELTQLAGCAHRFDRSRGGWTPQTSRRLETTIPGLFVAGESAGIGGAGAALVEGRVAGLAAAHRLGQVSEGKLDVELSRLAGTRRRLERFGAMLNQLFGPPATLEAAIADDTVLCRCEEVRAGEVRSAVAGGADRLDALKIWTRVGQGPCQGRVCGPILARLVARQVDRTEVGTGYFRVRPPIKPIPLGDLALAEIG